jgi:hypothetical protein
MWLKLTKNGYKLNFMEKVTFNYRRHENAITYLPNRNLVNHAYLWSEQFRKDNVYPFVEWQYRLDFQYKYKIALLVKIIFSNRSTRLSRWGYSFLLKWGNPFYYILLSGRIKKRIFGKQSPSPR